MTLPEDYNTSYTLIERLCDLNEQEAWQTVHENYTRFVFGILNKMGVATNDAEDVAQEVYIQLAKNIEKFDRDKGKFRTWFGTMISRTALKHFRKIKSSNTKKDRLEQYNKIEEQLQSDEMESLLEEEWKGYLCDLALERISQMHRGHAFDVLKLDLLGKSTSVIAQELNITVSSVYTLRARVRKTLANEVHSLRAKLEL